MPSSGKLGKLRTHGWLIAIACAYLYVFPYFPKIHSANELPRVYLVKAMVHDGTFAIDHGVAQWGATADVSPHGAHQYSNKSPGSSLLAVPVYALASLGGEPSLGVTMWICRFVTGIVPTLAFLWLLYGFLARFAPDPAIRKLVVIAYALGSMAMTYSLLYFSHQLGAVCIGSAWILALDVAEGKRRLRWAAAAGFLVGAAPLVDYQAVFAAIPIAIQVIFILRRDVIRLLQIIGIVIAFAAIPIAVLLTYHAICFGSPLRTGYDASTTFAMYHQQGFLGMTGVKWERFTGSMISGDNGLVTLAPWLLLAIPGAYTLGKTQRDTAVTCGAILVIYILFISSLTFFRGGWEIGPRYITVMLPFALPLVAAQLEAWRDRWWALGLAAGPIVVAIVIYALSSATFPYWPDSIANPLYDVTFRLIGDGLAAPNLASALGVVGIVGLVPFVGVVAGLTGWAIVRVASWRGLAIAMAVAVGVLVAYRAFPRGKPDRPYAFVRTAVGDR